MKTSDIIKNILGTDRQARNSDRHLILKVWERQGLYLLPDQKEKFYHDVASAESIRRTRQKLQEEGKYPADQIIQATRQFKGAQVQQNIPVTDADDVENLISLL